MTSFPRGHTRRSAVRFLSVCALGVSAALRSPSARAIRGWCRRDPIVKIGDRTVQISLFSDNEMNELATGPTELIITVPAGVVTRFVADDPGFGHQGYDVRFAESRELITSGSSVDVYLEAYAPATNPADGPLPLWIEFTPRGDGRPIVARAEGRANEWVSLKANLALRDIGNAGDAPPVAPPLPPEDESEGAPPADVPDSKAKRKSNQQNTRRRKRKSP